MKCMKHGGLYTGEYAERCGHSKASDPTTLEEQADYVVYTVNIRIDICRAIFGNNIFVGGQGSYQEINDIDTYGIYTSSSGRNYTEWRQDEGTTWGDIPINVFAGQSMASVGCGVYSATMLLTSVGIEKVTPGDAVALYDSNGSYKQTIEIILQNNNMSNKVSTVNNEYDFIAMLEKGYGFMTYIEGPCNFSGGVHWIVVAEIRTSELGSSLGYDVYVLSSTGGGRGWNKIEDIIDNLETSNEFGICIED